LQLPQVCKITISSDKQSLFALYSVICTTCTDFNWGEKNIIAEPEEPIIPQIWLWVIRRIQSILRQDKHPVDFTIVSSTK